VRITQRAVALTSLQGLNRNLDAVGKLQQQLTSGRVINAPSDSPTGTNKAMQIRAEQGAVAQHTRNISDATSWLDQGDSTIRSMLDTTRKVRDLTVQGLNTGAVSETSQEALAKEVTSLREGLLGLANTLVQGRPLFGGLTDGWGAFLDSGRVTLQVLGALLPFLLVLGVPAVLVFRWYRRRRAAALVAQQP